MPKKLHPHQSRGSPSGPAAPNRFNLWTALALVAATFAVYAQVRQFSFVNYDDADYVKAGSLRWAFTSTEAANWFPVTRLSHMLDVRLFGLDSGWHHLTSVALHAAAAVLLFLFLTRATGARGPSAFVAFVFALHPLHVQPVAWVAERKDVLCALFWFLALWAYVRRRQWLVMAAFVLGLMSKPMIVTLPFVLLLLDVWPLKRSPRVREKLPLFAIAAAGAVATYLVQRASGAVNSLGALGVENAVISYVTYIGKTFWPSGLAVFYPYPAELPLWRAALAAAALAAITMWVVWAFQRFPYLAIGWFWFLGTLVPVIGIVQVGGQARADRYMYVPMAGLAVMVAWGGADLLRKWPRLRMAAAAVACTACAVVAWAQAEYWRDSGTLFTHALEVTRGNYIAEHNLGAYLMQQPGQAQAALAHLREALRLRPESGQAHSDLGSLLAKTPGRLPEAIAELQAAVWLLPDAAVPHNNLANALADAERFPEAVAEYQAALRIQPDYVDARNNLTRLTAEMHYQAGLAFAHHGQAREAVAEFEETVRLNSDYAEAHNNLGVVLSGIPGKESQAIAHFREALRIRPDYDDARANLQVALQQR